MNKDVVILLDLEGTVITHWSKRELINIDKLKSLINHFTKKYNVTFGIYSYAIWCVENLRILKSEIIPKLEESFEITFSDDYIFHIDDLINNFSRKHTGIDYKAYCFIVDKQMSIIDFQKDNLKFKNRDIILIDAFVTHEMTVMIPEENSIKTILFLNPNKL